MADATTRSDRAPLRPAWVLCGHVLFTLLSSGLQLNIFWLMPMLVREQFGSADTATKDWQTAIITMAVPTCMALALFWGGLLQRLQLQTYLVAYWLLAIAPLGLVAFVQDYWQLLLCQVIAAIGFAGKAPLDGMLLRHFYPDAVRGRAFATLQATRLGGGIALVFFLGWWMGEDPQAFRPFILIAVAAHLLSMGVLWWLIRRTNAVTDPKPQTAPSFKALLEPVLHMHEILRRDRTFLRYEAAFMTYGAAFMICEALLPVVATDQVGMSYEDYAHNTQFVMRWATLLMILPVGWIHDRVGAMRTCGLAFSVLGLFPILLLIATSPMHVGLASVAWGVGMAGVSLGWTLGPVALAPTAAKAPQYLAIHATLVGVRGVIFQMAGMGLYRLTGSFAWPLGLAACMFFAGALQMWLLHGRVRRDQVIKAAAMEADDAPVEPVPAGAAATVTPPAAASVPAATGQTPSLPGDRESSGRSRHRDSVCGSGSTAGDGRAR